MNLQSHSIRMADFGPEHLPGAVRLSEQARWPHRAEDWELTLSQSRGVVALCQDHVIGTALASDFGAVCAISMIIVDQEYRGRGVGTRLMHGVLPLAAAREMRLTATQEGLPLYQNLGFLPVGKITQLQGIATPIATDVAVVAESGPIDDLVGMDTAASGLHRDDLLRRIAASGLVLRADRGFAMLRDFGRGKLLGPIVAEDVEAAQGLLAEAAARCEGQFLRIDTGAPDLADSAGTLGLSVAGGGISMAKNAQSPGARSAFQTFGLVSQALG